MTDFQALGLLPSIQRAIADMGFETPTPIQRDAIPLVIDGNDLMGLAQTGTGKTAAFGLPLVQKLTADQNRPGPRETRALILAPTRELAAQITENLYGFVKCNSMRVTLVVGGASLNVQAKKLERGTDILVATPGRLLDLIERKAVTLRAVQYLVLDEADQMLDLGFIHALRKISKLIPAERQTLLFSATMPKNIEDLARTYLRDPVRVEVAPPGKAADKIKQSLHYVPQSEKLAKLRDLLAERPDDLSLVFARTKHGAEKLMKSLVSYGFAASSIHGNKSQGQRERAIKAFKAGEIRILVATDVAARGIDISGVSHVYNYDLPDVPEVFVHRIGRTARAGASGETIAFCSSVEVDQLKEIEKLLGFAIPVASGEQPKAEKRVQGQRGQRRAQGGQRKDARRAPSSAKKIGKPNAKAGQGDKPGSKSNASKPRKWQRRAKRPAA